MDRDREVAAGTVAWSLAGTAAVAQRLVLMYVRNYLVSLVKTSKMVMMGAEISLKAMIL
jgi:hypothetical protein